MRREYHKWFSPRLARHMELLTYGHSGTPVLVFPTSQGRFYEYENSGMIHAVSQKIESGQLQFFCVDSVDGESWYNRGIHPHERVRRAITYEEYILQEVVPLMRNINGNDRIAATGCSLGGYYALNLSLKHPDITSACIAMSGAFDMRPFMDGYYDSDFYFNNPVDYVPNMNDPWFLERYGQMRIVLAVGDHDICLAENFRMAHVLGSKRIPHWLDVWTGGERHDWPLWQRMANKFF
jgi:esterase/lipase superfamily enzyme